MDNDKKQQEYEYGVMTMMAMDLAAGFDGKQVTGMMNIEFPKRHYLTVCFESKYTVNNTGIENFYISPFFIEKLEKLGLEYNMKLITIEERNE